MMVHSNIKNDGVLCLILNRILLIGAILMACSLLAGCNMRENSLTIGFIPLKAEEEMMEEYQPIQKYLEEQLNLTINIQIMDNYAHLVKAMKDQSIDIGFFGAFSYIAAESQMELTPLVAEKRKDSGISYYSYILTKNDSNISAIDDLKGKKFAFVDKGSTSGFVLPYALFKSRNIEMEDYFSEIHYSGSHGSVPEEIENSIVDAGAISSIQYEKLVEDGKIDPESFKILWKSTPIPSSPYVAGSELDEKLQTKFVNAMLAVHEEIPGELAKFDESVDQFVKVENKEYNSIRNISAVLGKEYMVTHFLQYK